jgi:hypothetical protein
VTHVENSLLNTILKVEVILSAILTIELLLISILKKRDLTSDKARRRLKKNMRLFWATIFILFLPLAIFVLYEALEVMSPELTDPVFWRILGIMEVGQFFLLNLGLLLSNLLFYKMRVES